MGRSGRWSWPGDRVGRKLDTVRVLTEIGVASPHRVTFMRCLKRVAERDYRAVIAQACHRHATRAASLAVVLCDVTSLHFEAGREDKLRKVGMSKEHRAGPQVTVGLLTTATGFPLEAGLSGAARPRPGP